MAASAHVELQLACVAPNLPAAADIEKWLEITVSESAEPTPGTVELCVRVVDENEIRELNSTYRHKDRSTNVLAFPAGLDGLPGLPQDAPRPLGDLVVCAPVVAREARAQGKDEAAHWCHMLVHGMLHLLGYDHETDADAETMESLEIRILAICGLENPYKTPRWS